MIHQNRENVYLDYLDCLLFLKNCLANWYNSNEVFNFFLYYC